MIHVFDFFSGCGGASCGFRNAGLKIILGLDNDQTAAKAFSTNIPEAHVITDNIREITTNTIAPIIDEVARPFLFSGCAPCQPFSRQNRQKAKNDDRIDLLQEFGRFVEAYLPDYIFVENVPGLQTIKKRSGPLHNFISLLHKLGYKQPKVGVVSALSYGVPQKRLRLIIIASLHAPIDFPQITHGIGTNNPMAPTVGDFIRFLPELQPGETSTTDPDHVAMSLSPLNMKRIQATPEGGGRKDWPKELCLDCHKEFSGHSDVYGRLHFDRPASGLTTKCVSYSNGRFGHPRQNRALSIREAACLQTFPLSYRFHGSIAARAQQIGNAVPPLLAERFGTNFLLHWEELQRQK